MNTIDHVKTLAVTREAHGYPAAQAEPFADGLLLARKLGEART